MPGNGQKPGGGQRPQMPANGQTPQMPDNSQAPQMPADGQQPQMPADGQQPQMPADGPAPQMPDNSQAPQMPADGQQPQTPGQDDRNIPDNGDTQDSQEAQGSAPSGKTDKNGRGGKRGNRNGGKGSEADVNFRKRLDFDQMLKDGVITQEIYDTIMNYMKDRTPQQQDDTASAESTEPPALPEDSETEPAGMEEELLKELLDGGMITQEQYDQLLTKLGAEETAAES